jgi:hypothetical protein
MADPVTMAVVSVGSNLIGGISQKRAADRAASAANQAAEFNAQLIERDVDLLARQRSIVNAQFAIDDSRMRRDFEQLFRALCVQARVMQASTCLKARLWQCCAPTRVSLSISLR